MTVAGVRIGFEVAPPLLDIAGGANCRKLSAGTLGGGDTKSAISSKVVEAIFEDEAAGLGSGAMLAAGVPLLASLT